MYATYILCSYAKTMGPGENKAIIYRYIWMVMKWRDDDRRWNNQWLQFFSFSRSEHSIGMSIGRYICPDWSNWENIFVGEEDEEETNGRRMTWNFAEKLKRRWLNFLLFIGGCGSVHIFRICRIAAADDWHRYAHAPFTEIVKRSIMSSSPKHQKTEYVRYKHLDQIINWHSTERHRTVNQRIGIVPSSICFVLWYTKWYEMHCFSLNMGKYDGPKIC